MDLKTLAFRIEKAMDGREDPRRACPIREGQELEDFQAIGKRAMELQAQFFAEKAGKGMISAVRQARQEFIENLLSQELSPCTVS